MTKRLNEMDGEGGGSSMSSENRNKLMEELHRWEDDVIYIKVMLSVFLSAMCDMMS